MKLGDELFNTPNNNSSEKLVRVPGGWIYTYGDMQGTSCVFIPFDNEFQKADEVKLHTTLCMRNFA